MISSNVIKEPNPKLIISSAYRAAFSEVFKVLSKEYAQKNISCINIAPGPINTDRTQELIENVEEFEKTLPMKRLGKPEEIGKLAGTQYRLLHTAFDSLRAGGILVYSTCSLEIEENEQVVENFVANTPMADIEPAQDYLTPSHQAGRYFQAIPGQQAGDGAFAARIRKRLA